MSCLLTIFQSLTILLSLADSEGVALFGLGGVNLDRLTALSKFKPNFLVLPGINTLGTCFGETELKIRPDVFPHNNCEQI